jgi:hydrogenase small subunit
MMSEGETALENMYKVAEESKGKFYLAIEGAIPTAEDGLYCVIGEKGGHHITMLDAVKELGAKAGAVLALGTCAAGGGIPGAKGTITKALPVTKIFEDNAIKTPVINIPGCAPHPDWIVGTIAYALTKGVPELDAQLRPKMFYGENIHENCPYLKQYEEGKFQKKFTEKSLCRASMGCKGPFANADCFKRKWNNGVNWCVENAICTGCVETTWPDEYSPFYEQMA